VPRQLGDHNSRNCCSVWTLCKFASFVTESIPFLTSTQAIAYSFGPTLIIDSIRTSIWHQSVFGSAYALKITLNNAYVRSSSLLLFPLTIHHSQNIIVRILTGVLQDDSPASNPYKKVTPVYVVLAAGSFIVSIVLLLIFLFTKHSKSSISIDIARLQWTRKQRIKNGKLIKARALAVGLGEEKSTRANDSKEKRRMRNFSLGAFGVLCLWILGSWVAYFWGVATGHND
jgi:hypothetical protein